MYPLFIAHGTVAPTLGTAYQNALWFDTAVQVLNYYNGTSWLPLAPQVNAGGGGATGYTNVLKTLSGRSGSFDITGLSGLTTDKPVMLFMSASPITSRGNARDEPELDMIHLTGYVVNTTTIRAYWQCAGGLSWAKGEYEFEFAVGG